MPHIDADLPTHPSDLTREVISRAKERAERDREALEDRVRRAARTEQNDAARAAGDPLRPSFHVCPPVGRLNDPNGLVKIGDTYHAYFQYTPLFPEKGVFWGHATSSDLMTWSYEEPALSPVDWFDTHGCYSGGAVVDGERVEFFYTGNVKDDMGKREPYQVLATRSEDGALIKRGPVIALPHEGYTAHFRDPDVTWRDGRWMMLLGAQREDGTGAIVRYGSTDRRDWEFEGEIEFSVPELNGLGYMIECPIVTRLEDSNGEMKDVILMCPQGLVSDGERLGNTDNLTYVVGRLEGTRFEVEGEMREVDLGFEVYAPQVFSGVDDRVILMAWQGNPGQDSQPSLEHGWVHTLTLPRELLLMDGALVQRVAREVDAAWPAEEISGSAVLDPFAGPVRGVVKGGDARIRIGAGDTHALLEVRDGELILDRSRSSYSPEGDARFTGSLERRHVSLPAAAEHEVEIFLDGSCLEVFVDGGKTVMTSRIFVDAPRENSGE